MAKKPKATPDLLDEAIAYFKLRIPGLSNKKLQQLQEQAEARAKVIAEAAQLSMATELYQAAEKAAEKGQTLEEFQQEIAEKLTKNWAGDSAPKVANVFVVNLQINYNAGRHALMTDPEVLDARPYWRFVNLLDPRTTEICKSLGGIVLPADSPFWKTKIPPLHYRCRSTIISLTEGQATKFGITKKPPKIATSEGFGMAPDTTEWAPDLKKTPAPLAKVYRRKA